MFGGSHIGNRRCEMQNTMAAAALSLLMAIGGGVAVAETGQGSSSSAAPPSQSSGQSATGPARPDRRGPVGFEEEEVETAPWTVQRVDTQKHTLVLEAPDGTQNTVNVPAGTPGFDSLKKGDQVQLDYFDAAVIEPSSNQASTAGSAKAGQPATSNGSPRKVRNIRKVGHSSNASMGDSSRNNMGHTDKPAAATDTGTSGTNHTAPATH